VIEYLERYAQTFDLPTVLDNGVQSLSLTDDRFVLELEDGSSIEANQVVVATGPFQVPRVPTFAADLAPEVFQIHSTGYRKPSDLPEGRVLVIGGGNTGFQIAEELAATRGVHLAVGSRQLPLPQRFLGRDLFWWLEKTRVLHKTADSRLGRRMRERDTLIGSSPRSAKRHGVNMKPRAVGVSRRTVSFADESTLDVDAVVWATGYRLDHSWIELPLADELGRLRHRRGITDVPGLYFLGLPWQHTRGSALLGWVKDDAEFIADEIANFTKDRTGAVREGGLVHAN
jgi:putative flavoprotein involved in K+ transport